MVGTTESYNLSLKITTENNAELKGGGVGFVIQDTHGHLVVAKAVYCSSVASSKVVDDLAMKVALIWIKDGWTVMEWSQIL